MHYMFYTLLQMIVLCIIRGYRLVAICLPLESPERGLCDGRVSCSEIGIMSKATAFPRPFRLPVCSDKSTTPVTKRCTSAKDVNVLVK